MVRVQTIRDGGSAASARSLRRVRPWRSADADLSLCYGHTRVADLGQDMSNTTEPTASPRQRVMFAVAAAIMLALWAWSLVPPIQNWGNPNEDGFSYVGVFYATIVCLPLGLYLLVATIAGHGRYVRRARTALFIAGAIAVLVVAFLIFQTIADSNDGKVFGIQIGARDLDARHARTTVPRHRCARSGLGEKVDSWTSNHLRSCCQPASSGETSAS
jgi:hypothetical protein